MARLWTATHKEQKQGKKQGKKQRKKQRLSTKEMSRRSHSKKRLTITGTKDHSERKWLFNQVGL